MSPCSSISISLRSPKENKTILILQEQGNIKKRGIQGWGFLLCQSMEAYGPKQSMSIRYFGNKNSVMAVLINVLPAHPCQANGKITCVRLLRNAATLQTALPWVPCSAKRKPPQNRPLLGLNEKSH